MIQKEKLIFPESVFERIRARGIRLGIVTGRNRFEAEYALERFGILKLFDCIVTIDDVKREERKTGESRRKPHPWPLVEAARRLMTKDQRLKTNERKIGQTSFSKSPLVGSLVFGLWSFLYVGDLPDDILTAQRAKKFIDVKSCAFASYARDPEGTLKELRKAKPDFFIKKPHEIFRIL